MQIRGGNGMKKTITYLELVKEYFPDVSDEVADWILWEKTPFPMIADEKGIRKYLTEYKKEVPD